MARMRSGGFLLVLLLGLAACGPGEPAAGGQRTGGDSEPTGEGAGYGDQAAEEQPAATVNVADTDLGQILVDGEGRTLYRFTPDTRGQSTCEGTCAENWPIVPADLTAGPGVLAQLGRVTAPDGADQLSCDEWPLYTFVGDTTPGETNGQGSGEVWYVVAPDCSLVGAEAPASAPADQDDADDAYGPSDSGEGGYGAAYGIAASEHRRT